VAAALAVGARRRQGQGESSLRNASAGAGLAVVAVALAPPLDRLAAHGLVAHMVQHVMLLVGAGPLLAAGRPVPTLLWSLPSRWRRRGLAGWQGVVRSREDRWAAWAAAGLIVAAVTMAAWHIPTLYGAALRREPVHAGEHLSLLLSATLFWWALGLGSDRPHGGAVPVLFVAALPGTALGAAMTLATTSWYPQYPSLADQQLAGVVMWAFAGLAYVLAAAVLFGMWLSATERETPGRPAGISVST